MDNGIRGSEDGGWLILEAILFLCPQPTANLWGTWRLRTGWETSLRVASGWVASLMLTAIYEVDSCFYRGWTEGGLVHKEQVSHL